ncbi:zinc finger and SCAN domain-containing protein 12 isoform X18 [Plutella xylostella]|uniref:zinc finger and SCAN domain-containing protein 12 isoform X18 n=1 Tax=Plutella xylostella TaxID=51655 RepID=UPI002032B124|nr:zinc finger and SCAN domain-containing protein 12 isoform X18 [Plutella xylostella]
MDVGKSSSWPPGPTVCRCCLAEGCYKDISTEYFWMGKREVYAEMLTETFDLAISYAQSAGTNSNSRLICEPCISRLRDASEFKRQVSECERMFTTLLEPGSSGQSGMAQVTLSRLGKDVKVERVKVKKEDSEDDDDDDMFAEPFGDDDDDDDADDEPLTNLATKIPKKEAEDDIFGSEDKPKPAEKRKATVKAKAVPAKKAKATVTKAKGPAAKVAKPQEKKKRVKRGDSLAAPMAIPKENAKLILKHSTAYPFIHSERKCIGCCFCTSAFEDPHSFRQHMDSEHQIDRSVTVNEKFITRVDIFELRCNVCTAEFPTLEPLAEHLVSQHQINIDTQHDLGLAALKLEKDRFFCYVCQKVFMAFYGLFLHSILHATRNICDVCGRNFATQKGLDGHVRSSHTTKVDFHCRGCKQTFESKEKRREHMATSKKCLPIRCRQCNERFTCKETLEHHRVESHGMPRRMYACKSCGGEFHNRTLLHYHFKANHTTDLKCQYCEKTFKVRSSLQEHVYFTHTGERPYKCSVCDKGVVSLRALAKHAIVHDDTKKLPCPVCGRLFIAKWKVRDHLKRHHPEIAP